ncbi:MAG: Acetate kinase [Planctomycetaceae bacterium]|nr:Acetate kinase [Planctomycetaceae bacterium]
MAPISSQILTVNSGSTSIKFAMFDCSDSLRRILHGAIERIGQTDATFTVTIANPAEVVSRPVCAADGQAAINLLLDWINERLGSEALIAVGHRIVHGGPKYHAPERITSVMLDDLRQFSPFDPEHLPQEILLAESVQRRFPELPQIGCFDTGFHHDLPRIAQLLPLPRRYEAQGVRRYGFHGLSYTYLTEELARLTPKVTAQGAAQGCVVFAHLGGGASLAAVRDGKPIDTSMGFTPTSGVMMGSRTGDLDPGLVCYLARTEQMTAAQFQRMVNHESGLIGVSETSSDMQVLLQRESYDVRAAEAVALFCYQVIKWIGAFAAAMGGLDALVFSGGIGENAPQIRSRICEGVRFLGIQLDEQRNRKNQCVISSENSRVEIRVIPTDEELIIARSVCRVLALS